MTKLDIIVGNSVDFSVDIEGLSDSPQEAKIMFYKDNEFGVGFTDMIKEVTPVSIDNGNILFSFDTEDMISIPGIIYCRFFVLDNNKKINAYFKLKFSY